jgi:hypothetical protein
MRHEPTVLRRGAPRDGNYHISDFGINDTRLSCQIDIRSAIAGRDAFGADDSGAYEPV